MIEPTADSRLQRVTRWGWPRRFPIVQFPNPPLAVALIASVAADLTEGSLHRSLRAVFFLALGTWAYEEACSGDNWFRRALGVGFLVYLTATLTSALST